MVCSGGLSCAPSGVYPPHFGDHCRTDHWSVVELVMFSMFSNGLDGKMVCACSKCADDTKLGGMPDISGGCADIERDLNKL